MAKRKRRPPKRKALTLEAWANKQAEKKVQAQVNAINAQKGIFQAEIDKDYQTRINQANQLAEAFRAQNFPGQIQQQFGNAANQVTGMAQAFQGETGAIANADAAEQARMLSGTGQELAVRNEGAARGNVTYGLGGWIPGRNFAETGAYMAADASRQPAYAQQAGVLEAGKSRDEQQKDMTQFALAIAEAKAGKFDFAQELLSERQASIVDQQKLRLSMLEGERDFWLQKQALYLSQGKMDLAQQAEARAQQAENRRDRESAGLDAYGNLMPGYRVGPNGQVIPPGYVVDRKGNIVRKGSSSSGSGANPLSPTGVASAMKDIDGAEEDIKTMAQNQISRVIVNNVPSGERNPGANISPKQKTALMSRIYQKYKHLARGNKRAQKRLRALIAAQVNQALQTASSGATTSSGGIDWGSRG